MRKILFIDRDGTIIEEPPGDCQVDRMEKLAFRPGVISALREIVRETDYRLVMVTNHLPRIKGDDDGIWRRIADMQCPRNFDNDPKIKKDPYLTDKCANEASGILNWLIEGLRAYRAEGLKMPEAIAASVKEYRSEMDEVGNWFSTRLVRDSSLPDNFEIDSRELYGSFRSYMESCGEKVWQALPDFHRRMNRLLANGTIEQDTHGGRPLWRRSHNKYRLRGYRFATVADEEQLEIDPADFI